MSRSLGQAAPTLELRKNVEGDTFLIKSLDRIRIKGQETWRLTCVDSDGVVHLRMVGSNTFRDTQLQAVQNDIAQFGELVGPVRLIKRPNPKGGNPMWDLEEVQG